MLLMKWQFVVTNAVCQTEIPTLLDSWETRLLSYVVSTTKSLVCNISVQTCD